MYPALLKRTLQEINHLKCTILFNEKIRNVISTHSHIPEIGKLKESFPSISHHKIFDHCLTVIRLYSLYEKFVEERISDWLITLPQVYSPDDLLSSITHQYRKGFGLLLCNLHKQRYKNLDEVDLIRKYLNIYSQEDFFFLVPEALTYHDQNLRPEILFEILNRVLIKDAQTVLSNHHLLKDFFKSGRGQTQKYDTELNAFIQLRNDVSHRDVDELLGYTTLINLSDFIYNFCIALEDLFHPGLSG